MADIPLVNPNKPLQDTGPAASQTTPAAPATDPGQQSKQIQQSTPQTPPSTNLHPGSTGADVSTLQQFLMNTVNPQTGQPYLSQQQVATGTGIYGPQTTAAVSALQKNLGVDTAGVSGFYGPKTQQALSQKYGNIYKQVQNQQVPQQQSDATQQIQSMSQTSTDPIFGAIAAQMAPVMESLSQTLKNINNPTITGASLTQDYNEIAKENNLPQLRAETMNILNIMNGTEDDIRDEAAKSGGVVTESQVLAMTYARNRTNLKMYNAFATQLSAAQQNVQDMMQYRATDQQTALQKDQLTASITESLASLEQQMFGMGIKLRAYNAQNYRTILSSGGPEALVQAVGDNPIQLSIAESSLGLAPGTLSNQDAVLQWQKDQYKTQQMGLAAYRANVYGFSQGYPSTVNNYYGGTDHVSNTYGTNDAATGKVSPGQDMKNIDISTLVRPSFLPDNVPLHVSSDMMQSVISQGGKQVSTDAAGNVTVQGTGYYVKQQDGSYVLGSSIPSNQNGNINTDTLLADITGPKPPTLTYPQIAAIIQNAPPSKYPPASTAFYREQRSARQLVANYVGSSVYQTVQTAPLQFARVQAALNGDNSISDVELLDADVMLSKGSGQVTQGQVDAIQNASSYSDKLNILNQKIFGQGAALSGNQRRDVLRLTNSIFNHYASVYQNLYTNAVNVLAKNHVEPSMWNIIPDFSTLISGVETQNPIETTISPDTSLW